MGVSNFEEHSAGKLKGPKGYAKKENSRMLDQDFRNRRNTKILQGRNSGMLFDFRVFKNIISQNTRDHGTGRIFSTFPPYFSLDSGYLPSTVVGPEPS
jgi:hypothetical protein